MLRALVASFIALTFTAPAAAEVQSIETEAGPVTVTKIAGDLDKPWGAALLPDGDLLVTELSGNLLRVAPDGTKSAPLAGTPEVFTKGQGGLMDVALHPDFENNRLVYLSFAEGGPDGAASTALGRGRLGNDRIEDFEVIFRQQPKVTGPNHFGNRIVFSPDGYLFLTLGERFKFDPAQDRSNTLGAVVRLNDDGSIPQDNPFMGDDDAEDAIWSYGHRNIEAAAIDPATGQLWIAEMGPLGGDEFNAIEKGANYGWPVVSKGRHYSGEGIPDPSTRSDFHEAALYWTPVISPSGMIFYEGEAFPEWRGDAFIGALSGTALVRVETTGETAREAGRIPLGARIRDVVEAADGSIYVLTNSKTEPGNIWRLAPLQ
ncbi:MAG: hypothetical protein CMI63_14990 [Parvularcula sp.]|nr:hypothetical protein [Parvularcula sp.]